MTNNPLGQSWLTTIVGLVFAVANALLPLVQQGTIDAQTLLNSAALAAIGWASKSFNVSGADQKKEE